MSVYKAVSPSLLFNKLQNLCFPKLQSQNYLSVKSVYQVHRQLLTNTRGTFCNKKFSTKYLFNERKHRCYFSTENPLRKPILPDRFGQKVFFNIRTGLIGSTAGMIFVFGAMLSGARADEIDEEMLRNSIKNADAVILMNGDNVSSDLKVANVSDDEMNEYFERLKDTITTSLPVFALGATRKVGLSGLLGFLLGYIGKHSVRVLLLTIAGEIVLLTVMSVLDLVQIKWEKIARKSSPKATYQEAFVNKMVDLFVYNPSLKAGFFGGFYIGLKYG